MRRFSGINTLDYIKSLDPACRSNFIKIGHDHDDVSILTTKIFEGFAFLCKLAGLLLFTPR